MARFALLLAFVSSLGLARADVIGGGSGGGGDDTGADVSEEDGCGNKASGTAAASAVLGLFLLGRLRRRSAPTA
jgi:hypothetical protein